jgi:hypothetical protein
MNVVDLCTTSNRYGMVLYGVCLVCVYKIVRVRLCECSSVRIKAICEITLHDCFEKCIADDFVVLEFNSHKSGLSQ